VAYFCSKHLLGPDVDPRLSLDGASVESFSEQSGRLAIGTARAVVACTRRTHAHEGPLPSEGRRLVGAVTVSGGGNACGKTKGAARGRTLMEGLQVPAANRSVGPFPMDSLRL
jgi:hypothetical protein